MQRGRKVALVAHCLLNANARVEGLASHAGVHPLLAELTARGYGVLQLPCPEFTLLGGKRWGQTREQYDTPWFAAHCARLAGEVTDQVREHRRCGVRVGPVVGVEGSPSCGVARTSSGPWGGEHPTPRIVELRAQCRRVAGPGLLMAALQERLEPLGVRFVAVDGSEEEDGVEGVLAALG